MKEYCSICSYEIYEGDEYVELLPPVGLVQLAHADCADGFRWSMDMKKVMVHD